MPFMPWMWFGETVQGPFFSDGGKCYYSHSSMLAWIPTYKVYGRSDVDGILSGPFLPLSER